MAEYRTRDQVEQYLAQILNPDRQFDLYPFETGWLCQAVPTAEETASGQAIGMTNLVIDSQTGAVIEYPSWSGKMIADDFREAKATGRPPKGRQIYPRQWRLNFQRIQEDPETITYRVQVQSQAQPPEPNAEYQLTINKGTLNYQGTGPMAGNVLAWAELQSSRDGTWPGQGTFEV